MKNGDPVTVVLKHAANAVGKSRLVHTEVYNFPGIQVSGAREDGEVFQANDDDRVQHRVADVGVTWLRGHVLLDGPEALELVKRAELEDVSGGDR